jgi:hypothetical protein
MEDLEFEVGDWLKFVLRSGNVEEGVVRPVFQTTAGAQLHVPFEKDLVASVNAQQVVEKLPPAA